LTERPACFEIDPRARAVKQRLDVDRARLAPRRLFRIDPLFTMSDNARAGRREAEASGRAARAKIFLADERRSCWWSQTGSNRRPPACKAGALPTELWPRSEDRCRMTEVRTNAHSDICHPTSALRKLVGLGRFELPTSRLSSARSNQLSYKPGSDVGCQMTGIRSACTLTSVI
jgi:hypothetical protein